MTHRTSFLSRIGLIVATLAALAARPAASDAPAPAATESPVERAHRAEQAFSDALKLEQKGDLRTAIGAYSEVVRSDSTYPEANYRMGRLLASLDLLREAVRAYGNELRFHPEHVAAQRELGLTLARTGKTAQAIGTLENLTQKQPTDDQAWQALGFAYSLAGRADDAEKALRRAISYPPERASEHRDLGVVLAGAGRESEALDEYHAAIALDENDPATWANLGNLEARAGRWRQALNSYRIAEKRDSTYALALQGQLVALDALHDSTSAAATARRWLRVRPDDHRARLDAVSRFHQIHRDDIALALARDGVTRNPSSGDAHVVLSSMYDIQGRSRDAMRELRVAARLFRDPLNRGHVVKMMQATLAALPESLRVVVRSDSADEARRRATRRSAR